MLILDGKFLTAKEAAVRYGRSSYWFVKKRVTKDGPPYIKLGQQYYYPVDECDAWFGNFFNQSLNRRYY